MVDLNKWRHPTTDQIRIYLNGMETSTKVWLERGSTIDSPAAHEIKLCAEKTLSEVEEQEVIRGLEENDLYYRDGRYNLTWEQMSKWVPW